MTKLNQIIAVEKGVKTDASQALTAIYHQLQKGALFAGLSKTYRPRDEDGEQLPGEGVKVQQRAEQLLDNAASALTRLFDITATKDLTNTVAKADVVIDGTVLLEQVPVATLLFLEKQLTDFKTVVSKLPVLDPSESWAFNSSVDAWTNTPAQTVRTKKVPKTAVVVPATDKHPAQVQVWQEDLPVGDWTTVKFSGAVPQARVTELLSRIENLRQAVKYAREHANGVEVLDKKIGEAVFEYILGD